MKKQTFLILAAFIVYKLIGSVPLVAEFAEAMNDSKVKYYLFDFATWVGAYAFIYALHSLTKRREKTKPERNDHE